MTTNISGNSEIGGGITEHLGFESGLNDHILEQIYATCLYTNKQTPTTKKGLVVKSGDTCFLFICLQPADLTTMLLWTVFRSCKSHIVANCISCGLSLLSLQGK